MPGDLVHGHARGPGPEACLGTRSRVYGRLARRPARAGFAVPGLALAQVARELGGEGIARRQLEVLLDRVRPVLELLDVRGGLFVAGNRLADLLLVRLSGLVELGRVDLGVEQGPQP